MLALGAVVLGPADPLTCEVVERDDKPEGDSDWSESHLMSPSDSALPVT